MRPRELVFVSAVLLAFPLQSIAQDTTTLEGEPAIRFMAGHGHIASYCEGQLWITPTRLRFDSSLGSKHSFDLKRAEVKDFHVAHAFGFHYMKTRGGGRTYRIALYPGMARDPQDALGDRFRLAERAWRDFPAAAGEVEHAAAQRVVLPGTVRADLTEKDGAMLEFPAFTGPQFLWFRGADGVTIWAKPEAGGEAYKKMMGRHAAGKLQLTADRVRFVVADAAKDGALGFDYPREEVRLYSGAGGYPRIVLNTRHGGRVSIVLGEQDGDQVRFYDVTPLLRALGPDFQRMVTGLLATHK